jgi:Haem-binding domain
MKKYFKIGFLILLGIFIIMQFIRPSKNINIGIQANNITNIVAIPADVNAIFQKACYDCHSNNTKYPWYAEVMPAGYFLANHVNDGKKHFNFDEFASYKPKKALHKLEELANEVQQGEMPMDSYTWIHKDAKLTDAEKKIIVNWAGSTIENLKNKYKDTIAKN